MALSNFLGTPAFGETYAQGPMPSGQAGVPLGTGTSYGDIFSALLGMSQGSGRNLAPLVSQAGQIGAQQNRQKQMGGLVDMQQPGQEKKQDSTGNVVSMLLRMFTTGGV